MSRRSPHNERYKKGQTPKGVSKRSAASAKPARAKAKGADTRKTTAQKSTASYLPDWPQFKAARKKWWSILGVSAVVMSLMLALTFEQVIALIPLSEEMVLAIRVGAIYTATGLIAYVWWIDLKEIRPMMKAHRAGLSFEEYQVTTKAGAKADRKADSPSDEDADADDEADPGTDTSEE